MYERVCTSPGEVYVVILYVICGAQTCRRVVLPMLSARRWERWAVHFVFRHETPAAGGARSGRLPFGVVWV